MATKQQIVLQTFLANDMVPKSRIDFARSLANARFVSQKQADWVDKICADILNPPVVPKGQTIDSSKIAKLFELAQKKLKRPKVSLQTKSGDSIRCAMAGKNSKYAGSIMLNAGGFGTTFYGSIKPSGEMWLAPGGRRIERDLMETLNEFAADPAGVAAKYGKLTSHCCFCSLPLSTPESLAVGYGDTCAAHWELPWGVQKKSGKEHLDDIAAEAAMESAVKPYKTAGEMMEHCGKAFAYSKQSEEWSTEIVGEPDVRRGRFDYGSLNDLIAD